MKPITAKKVLFIKLGKGGEFEADCINNGELKIGFRDADFQTCLKGKWGEIYSHYLNHKTLPRDKKTASRFMGEIQYFFEEPEDTLWITYYDNKVWWAFSHNNVKQLPDKRKTRKVIGKWHDCDINGNRLSFDNLSGELLKTQGYHGTICTVSAAKYLINKINGIQPEEIVQTQNDYSTLQKSVEKLIKKLNWKDFELLVDLIFRNAGWQRLGVLGKTQKSIDLDLKSPVTQERAFVQVKSQSKLSEFEESLNNYQHIGYFNKFFFIVHSSQDKRLLNYKSTLEIIVWRVNELAELTIDSGLVKWLIKKAF